MKFYFFVLATKRGGAKRTRRNPVQRGDNYGAIDDIRTSLRKRPGRAKALYNLGMAFLGVDKIQESIEAFDKAESVLPADSKSADGDRFLIHHNRALAYVRAGATTSKKPCLILKRLVRSILLMLLVTTTGE